MLSLLGAVTAWKLHPGFVTPVRHYHITKDVCDVARPNFHEDWLFSWRTFDCSDLRTMIRHAFDAWQYNSDTIFHETRNETSADVVIGTEWLGELQWIALARPSTISSPQVEIRLDAETCWYTDRQFCHAVDRDRTALSFGLTLTWVVFLAVAICNASRRPMPYLHAPRLFTWVIVIAIPLLTLASLLPCIQCHDFTTVMIHEVGHILGFGHSDLPEQLCGCGGEVSTCTTNTSSSDRRHDLSIMQSGAQRRNTMCLSRDDVDGVRSIYGGVCDDPIWCYENVSTMGYTRVSTALLYSFCIAALIVFVRNRVEACRSSSPSPPRRVVVTVPVVRTLPPSSIRNERARASSSRPRDRRLSV